MGKTYRYSPDPEDLGPVEHRLPRNERRRAIREATRLMRPHLPPVKIVAVPKAEVFDLSQWIPPKETDQTEGFVRQHRLDILHTLGEMMLESGLEPA